MELIRQNFEKEEIPERLYRSCDGLLSLQRKTCPVVFEKACSYALNYGLLSYKSLKRIIENKTYELVENKEEILWDKRDKKPPLNENIRGKEYYNSLINN
jgi:hypothetical protein